jgi:hypothetical protein
MPRLRYKKDYEGLSHELQREASTWEEPTDEILTSEGERPSGQSWLSNAVIIASLEDKKIRQQLDYHKTMVRFLEGELLARLAGRREYRKSPDYARHGTESVVPPKIRKRSPRLNKVERVIKQAIAMGLPPEVIQKILG